MLSSIFFSDYDKNALRTVVKTMIYFSAVICGTVTVAVLIAARPLVGLFLENRAAEHLAVNGMRLFVLSLVPCAFNTCFKNYYQGIDRIKLTQVISVLQNFVLPTLTAFILSRILRINGAWLGFLGGELLTLAFIAVFVFRENRHIAFTAENFSLIPEDFGIPDDDLFERSITGPEDVSRVSEAAARFCSSRGLDERLSKMISLCVEEMANNTIQHSFHKDDKEHNIDIRILIMEEGPVIRIRDNCVHFDPVKYFEIHKEDEGREDHIGIRMVMGMVKKVNYVNTLGLNNLTLTI